MSRVDQRGYTDADRAEAVGLMRKHGAAKAARLTGIPGGTLRRWRMERGESGPPSGVAIDDWATQKERGAREAWKTAMVALRKVRPLLAAGKAGDAQKAALTAAILIDKSQLLQTNAAAARTHVRDGEPSDAAIHVPDDTARLAEIATLLREIGALDNKGRDSGRRNDRDLRPMGLATAREDVSQDDELAPQ